jgi:hypothetical protein
MFVQIDGEKNLIRDISTRAILNRDRAGLEEYKLRRELAKRKQEEELELKAKVNKLEDDITEIKSMLHELVKMRT